MKWIMWLFDYLPEGIFVVEILETNPFMKFFINMGTILYKINDEYAL